MTRRPTRPRTLASALAASGLLVGALLASGTAAAAPSHPAGAARASASKANNGPPAGAPVTSPAPGQVFAPGSSIKLSAAPLLVSDAAKDGLSSAPVTAIKFYASTSLTNNVLVGEAKSAPWTVSWNHVPAGDYSVTAVTYNKQGSTTSDPVAIQVVKPSVLTAQSSLTITKGHSASFAVKLSTAPSSPVTVHLSDAGTGTTVSKGQALTFTPSNWNQPQPVTVAAAQTKAGSHSTITASAAGLGSASVAVTAAPAATGYDQWFLNLYNQLTNSSNGYFSPKGIPYHSVEQLIVEAPDYGHETTSETFSYWLWLTADFGRVSGDWTAFNNAWSVTMQYDVPNAANQPGCSAYNASSPATYGPEAASPASYPVALNSSVPVGSDPLSAELTSTYGGCTLDTPMWIMDTDNRYGFGQQEDGTSTPSYINTFQRGAEESVWDTVDQPDWDNLSKGQSGSGYLALFNNGGGSFASQYKYTDAPDADARMIQAAYWALQYATAQGNQSQLSSTLASAAKLGDYVRYSMYDKYFKQISANCSQVGSVACPAGTSKANESTYLLSWYYAFGGSTTGAWSWRISGTEIHEGYQNPLAAFALSNTTSLIPLSPSAKADWGTSLTTQLNLMQWLQSNEGAIAGGVTNNWGGNYGDAGKPPAGDPTFDGMYYDFEPVYHNPPSNQWFGYQAWPMERVAEYYYVTGNAQAKAILQKWVAWAESVDHGQHHHRGDLRARAAQLERPAGRELHDRHLEHGAAAGQPGPARHRDRRMLGRHRRGRLAGQDVHVLRGQVRRHHRGNRRAEHHRRHPPVLRRQPRLLGAGDQDRLQQLHLGLQHHQLRGPVHPVRLDRELPRPRQHPDDLRRQHLPVHPPVVHQRGELPRGAELPERRGRPGVQLPPVLGRGGHRDGVRLVRLPVPERVPASQRHPHGHGDQPRHPDRHRRHR